MKQQRGFTLLELLIAISIFAVVSAISYGTLAQTIEQTEYINRERDYWRRLSMLMVQMEDDLTYAVNRGVRDIYGTPAQAFIGQPVDSRAVSPPSLEFTRSGQWVLVNNSAPVVGRIAYRLRDHKIIREKWTNLDRAATSKPAPTILLDNIEEMKLRFLSRDGKWTPVWPPAESRVALPLAVEVTITTTNKLEFRRLLVTNG